MNNEIDLDKLKEEMEELEKRIQELEYERDKEDLEKRIKRHYFYQEL